MLKIKYYAFLILLIACEKKENKKRSAEAKEAYINSNISNREIHKEENTLTTFMTDAGSIGFWGIDKDSLPVFHFTASLPVRTFNKLNEEIPDPADPWFILSNYRFNAFVNVSGTYSLLSMERAIARLNYEDEKQKNITFTTLDVDGTVYTLTGIESQTATNKDVKRSFGAGYASFEYFLPNGIEIKRSFSLPPSENVKEGTPGMLITIELENTADKTLNYSFKEGLQVKYDMRYWHNYPNIDPMATYPVVAATFESENAAMVRFTPKELQPLVFGDSLDYGRADKCPPAVFMQTFAGKDQTGKIQTSIIDSTKAHISGEVSGVLKQGEKARFHFIVGYSSTKEFTKWQELTQKLRDAVANSGFTTFAGKWKNVIPTFSTEKDALMKLEMQWHAYVLKSMASYSEFYDEVFIPQGNVYEYEFGVAACMNDWMDHVLPLCYYDKELAKSIIRFGLRHSDFQGNLVASDEGMGRIPKAPWQKSHSQLYLLMALGEYLKQTQDAAFLNEEIPFSGYPHTAKGTILDRIERIFFNQRDVNYTGKHGIARALLSDNNDVLYYFFHNAYPKVDFPTYFWNAESMSNAAMAALYLPYLANALTKINNSSFKGENKKIEHLVSAINLYRKQQLEALIKNWGNNPYAIREYVGDKVFGRDTIFSDLQCYAIGIKDLPLDRRKQLWKVVQEKLGNGEKKGIRYTDKALTIYPENNHTDSFMPGEHEQAGVWYYTNAPLITGYADVDPVASWEAFKRMTFMQHTKDYPDYWVGMWSAPDAINSSLSPNEGTTSGYTRPFPVYCAHPHAWLLYMYLKLKDLKR